MENFTDNAQMGQEFAEGAPIDPNVEGAEPKDERKWLNAEGQEVSKSAFIREQFTVNNLSRKEISDKYQIPYRTVYGATVNMANEAEPASRGRGIVNPKIQVTVDNKVLLEENGKYFLNGEEITAEQASTIETVETDRNAWIKSQVDAGVNRGDVAKYLGLSYGVVYGLTKEAEGTRQKYEVELPDGSKMGRAEYIRKRIEEGASKADVAKELNVEYSVVWQATKKAKTTEEKFQDAIAVLEKFAGSVKDVTAFNDAIAVLKTLEIIVEEEESNGTDTTPTEA
jgi:transposase